MLSWEQKNKEWRFLSTQKYDEEKGLYSAKGIK